MAGSLIDEPKAWKTEEDPENLGNAIQKLRVYLDSLAITPSGLNVALKITNTTVTTIAGKLPLSPLSDRNSLLIVNEDTTSPILIGNADVTTSGSTKGFIIAPDSYFSLDIKDTIEIYGVCAAGTVNVQIVEFA